MSSIAEPSAPPAPDVPATVPLPPAAERHYRAFAWVVHEQRLMALLFGALAAASALVWFSALRLREKPPVVVRAAPSLRAAADSYYGAAEISYDELAFFLNGCVPLLYAADAGRHPWLSLAEGLVSPDLCREAEHRLGAHAAEMAARGVSQWLTLSDITRVVSDAAAGRAAALLTGYLTVATRDASPRHYPWQAQAVLAVNPGGRLNPYPYYLLSLHSVAADVTGAEP